MEAFVIMPFTADMDHLFRQVIGPACANAGVKAARADEILNPGSIPDQIQEAILGSLFVIAEISKSNDNVFYELGYAHAVHKSTVLLSNREQQLPFDVRVNRAIFYDQSEDAWSAKLSERLTLTIQHLFNLSERISLLDLKTGMEMEGHMHTVSGVVRDGRFPQHLWFFARREDLDTWWPQDDGEVRVQADGSWTGQLWLGREDRDVDIERVYDVRFGFLDASDTRELTELTVRSKFTSRFPGIRDLPQSFEEIAHVKVKRTRK